MIEMEGRSGGLETTTTTTATATATTATTTTEATDFNFFGAGNKNHLRHNNLEKNKKKS